LWRESEAALLAWSSALPAWSSALRALLCHSPNSVPPERAFSNLDGPIGDAHPPPCLACSLGGAANALQAISWWIPGCFRVFPITPGIRVGLGSPRSAETGRGKGGRCMARALFFRVGFGLVATTKRKLPKLYVLLSNNGISRSHLDSVLRRLRVRDFAIR
jgi:hypothetical protein